MVAIKPDYHYTKARALLRRAEKDAHMISKDSEHKKLMDLAQMHMAMYEALKNERPAMQMQMPTSYDLYNSENTMTTATGDVVSHG